MRDELTQALAEGRGVTAKVRWMSRADDEGRNRWIHCTPLIGSNGQIGVWMLVIVDDEQEDLRRSKQAPPVMPNTGKAHSVPLWKNSAANVQGAWPSDLESEMGTRSGWPRPNGTPERQTQPSDWNLETLRRDRAIDNPDTEGDDEYETLEERLQNKRRLEASQMYDQPGSVKPVRRTYKSLSPFPFSLDD